MLSEENVQAPHRARDGSGRPVLVVDPVEARLRLDQRHQGNEAASFERAQGSDLLVAFDEGEGDISVDCLFLTVDDPRPLEGIALDNERQVVDRGVVVGQSKIDELGGSEALPKNVGDV